MFFIASNPCGGAYAIACGLDQAIDYIKDLHFEQEDIDYLRSTGFFQEDFLDYLKNFRFTGDIYAIPEGTVIFPKEPLVKVIAPIMEAQLVETALLEHHQPPEPDRHQGRPRRSCSPGRRRHGVRSAPCPGSGCRYLRCQSRHDRRMHRHLQRSLAGQMFDVPVKGTHAHSWIMSFPDPNWTAFRTYAELYPGRLHSCWWTPTTH